MCTSGFFHMVNVEHSVHYSQAAALAGPGAGRNPSLQPRRLFTSVTQTLWRSSFAALDHRADANRTQLLSTVTRLVESLKRQGTRQSTVQRLNVHRAVHKLSSQSLLSPGLYPQSPGFLAPLALLPSPKFWNRLVVPRSCRSPNARPPAPPVKSCG